ncbi:glutaredoxin [Alteromonadaceae bacterium 2753L.S.0a.02]|nr:glutaredoxin [Alteromonadaceae bacterium 2753L.S.0a.02]
MKNIILFLMVVYGAYQVWQKYKPLPEPLFNTPYVAVYGRDSCGWTQKMIKELKRENIPYQYFIIDREGVAAVLHERMKASGISTRRYNLPVVDTNGTIEIRPNIEQVTAKYYSTP